MFGQARKWIFALFGAALLGKAYFAQQWLTAAIGLAVIAYAFLVPG